MRKCAEPECTAYVNTLDRDALCYYHRKLAAGLLAIGLTKGEKGVGTFDDYVRRYPDPRDATSVRHRVRDSGVLDDEQEQLADILTALGADQLSVKRALTREVKRHRRLQLKTGASR